jgi:hypothetical protein
MLRSAKLEISDMNMYLKKYLLDYTRIEVHDVVKITDGPVLPFQGHVLLR